MRLDVQVFVCMCMRSLPTTWAAAAAALSPDYQIMRSPHHDRLVMKSVSLFSFLVPIDICVTMQVLARPTLWKAASRTPASTTEP